MGAFLFFDRKKAAKKNRNAHFFSNGQAIAEYVILIAIVAAAILAMEVYARRGIQAAIKVASDQVGAQQDSQEDASTGASTNTNERDTSLSTTRQTVSTGGSVTTAVNENSIANSWYGHSVYWTAKN